VTWARQYQVLKELALRSKVSSKKKLLSRVGLGRAYTHFRPILHENLTEIVD